jgi:hypothetical protein
VGIHARLRYDLVFCGGDSKCKIVFKLLEQVIQIISGMRFMSCRQLSKHLNVPPVTQENDSENTCLSIIEINSVKVMNTLNIINF